MTYDEYTKLAGTVTADNAPTVLKAMLEGIKTDLTELETARAGIAEKDTRIKDLQDTNMKLFLSITGTSETAKEEEEKSPEDYRADLVKEIAGGKDK
jgi:hypothetical protein